MPKPDKAVPVRWSPLDRRYILEQIKSRSFQDVAREVGVSRQRIGQIAVEANVDANDRRGRPMRSFDEAKVLAALQRGESITIVARDFGAPVLQVRKIAVENNIARRTGPAPIYDNASILRDLDLGLTARDLKAKYGISRGGIQHICKGVGREMPKKNLLFDVEKVKKALQETNETPWSIAERFGANPSTVWNWSQKIRAAR